MITNTNQAYIGASIDIKRRWSNHLARIKKGIHPYFKDFDNTKYEILEECTVEELQEREEFWIGYMSSLFTVLNKIKPGRTPFNSQEAKLIKSQCQQGSNNGNCRLSEQDVYAIRQLYREGDYTQVELAERFKVSTVHISRIVNGKRWGSLEEDNEDAG